MSCSLALLLAAAGLQEVVGLQPAEAVRSGPSVERGAVVFAGRVLDAESGIPVPAAVVELWTEDNERPAVRTHRQAVAFDGSFVLRASQDELAGEKWVVHAPGHGSAGGAVSSFEEIRLLPRGTPFELRFLDIEGRPVPGVRVRTMHSCAHDAPAARGRSGPEGRLTLAAPPLLGTFELYVEREGYGSRLLWISRSAEDVFLLRIPPVPLRFLDAAGAPAVERRVLHAGTPLLVRARTDAEGRVLLATRYADAYELELAVSLCEDGHKRWWGGGWPPDEGEWVLRYEGEGHEPAPSASARLVLVGEDGDIDPSLVRAYHEDGWWYLGPGEHDVPPGRLRVVAGQAFSGWRTEARELTLAAGERSTVVLALEREPTLELLLPSPASWTIYLQGPEQGAFHEVEGQTSFSVPVPAGVSLTVLAEGEHGEVRRGRVEAASDRARLDLRESRTLVRQERGGARSTVAVTASDDVGRHIEARCILVPRDACALPEDEDPAPQRSVFRVPVATPFELEVRGPGCVSRWIRGVAPEAPEQTLERRVTLDRRASLVVEGPLLEARAGGSVQTRTEPGELRFEELAPGPLLVEAIDAAGWLHVWNVELAPGELRRLRLP